MLPNDFWINERDKLAMVIRPRLQALALAGALAAAQNLVGLGIHIDDDLVNTDAAAWARRYTDDLLNKLGTTSERLVGEIIANWAETPGASIGQLEKSLLPILDNNQIRAWRVAVTETTRAYSEGNDIAHQRAGIPRALFKPPAHPNCYCDLKVKRLADGSWVQVWYTNNDEKVCVQTLTTPWGSVDGCRALHGVVVSEGIHLGEKT